MEKENSEIKELLNNEETDNNKKKNKNNKKNNNKKKNIKEKDYKETESKEVVSTEKSIKETDTKEASKKDIKVTENKEDDKTKLKFNTVLDQLLLISGSLLLTILIDYSLPLVGYRLKTDVGASYLFTLVIYFIANCIYGPIAQRKREKKLLQK